MLKAESKTLRLIWQESNKKESKSPDDGRSVWILLLYLKSGLSIMRVIVLEMGRNKDLGNGNPYTHGLPWWLSQ